MIEFTLPSLGSDMEDGKLLEWKVRPGDRVTRGQVVAVVDTSKAAVEVEIWQEGTVVELVTALGEKIPVGAVMARLAAPGEDPATVPRRAASGAAPAPAPSPIGPTTPAPAAAQSMPPAMRKAASPAARKRARELDVDVESVTGTGPHGAVTIEDVERASSARAQRSEAAPSARPAVKVPAREPVVAPPGAAAAAPAAGVARALEMRRAIAAAMSRSKREIPHYYLAETIPLARAAAWLARENAARPVTERILMGALQLKAVALALQEHGELNGFWRDGAHVPATGIHVGVAIALRTGGLIAPAIHDTAELPLGELMRQLADLVRRVRAGSLRSSELSDPTVTVTNLGEQGAEAVYGVIYPPQVALVGFGRVHERAWAEDGALRAMPVAIASLAADHRVTDGHRGARFLAALRERLQHPEDL